MSKHNAAMGRMGLAVVGAALGAVTAFVWARKGRPPTPAPELSSAREAQATARQPQATVLEPAEAFDAFDDLPPDSTVFEPEPVSDRHFTARPRSFASSAQAGDDLESISADDLGAAYLARATDSLSDPDNDDPSSVDEIPGFRIITLK